MRRCIDTVLAGGEDIEILIVNDGSTDDTEAIAFEYAKKYPNIIKTISQENGGHGAAVETALANARGTYFKIVDSDDWVDEKALVYFISAVRSFLRTAVMPDMIITNYVYEHAADNTRHRVRFANALTPETLLTWQDIGRFRPGQYMTMHSQTYRTELLKKSNINLPHHAWYVDTIYSYKPLPNIESIYYIDVDLYRYFIGRSDQSVNTAVMLKRIDQQLNITRILIDSYPFSYLRHNRERYRYMIHFLAMYMTIASVLLIMSGTKDDYITRKNLWNYLRRKDERVYRRIRYRSANFFLTYPSSKGKYLFTAIYHVFNRIFKFS